MPLPSVRPTRRRILGAISAAPAAFALRPAWSQDFQPAVVYAVGQKFDKSFNEGAYNGAMQFQEVTGVQVLEYEPQAPAEFDRAVRAVVRRGATDVAAVGFYYAQPLESLAPELPDVRFTLIDAIAAGDNVRSVVFAEQEGSFLTGVLAALKSQSGIIGFIGAVDIPLIRKFAVGFEDGARWARPDIEVLVNFIGGTMPAAFNDPTTGAELARSQFDRGADVIFAGAAVSNFGIFQEAVARNRYAIGVDSNQNWMRPGHILTSMLKRVDLAVIDSFTAAREGSWTAGIRRLGLAEGGVDYAVDEHNRPLLTEEMIAKAEEARAGIIAGTIQVTDPTA